MRVNEKHYDFRKKMLEVHKKNIRDFSLEPIANELVLTNNVKICIENNLSDVINLAAKDFTDYLFTSMNIAAQIDANGCTYEAGTINVRIAKDGEDLGEGNGYMGSKIIVGDNVTIIAFDERGAAQALYYLEDLMSIRKAPYLEKGTNSRRTMYSPRMIHSGYGIDWFPNEHLAAIAHAGMDAILVFVKDVNVTTTGYMDMNELIHRASKYGIDVYCYSYMKSLRHPDDPDAEEFYEGTYGNVFRNCPGFKGVILVGESVGFPSKDPHTTGTNFSNKSDTPTNLLRPRDYPCCDYPEFLELLKKVIRKYNPDADIVMWSYNWIFAPLEARIELIERLPKDISFLATYEMGDFYNLDGIIEKTSDYTVSRVGPAPRFTAEADAAKRRGLKLYTMANTGGLTWDFGMIPYEPFPYQWQRRHDNMKKDYEERGLCGVMESHHYGFYPSFISELAKWNFTVMENKPEDVLGMILERRYGNKEIMKKALKLWSEGIDFYIAVNCDQYGPFRIGPAYPMNFTERAIPPESKYAHFGTYVLDPEYSMFINNVPHNVSIPQLSVPYERDRLIKMREKMDEGIALIETIENRNDELEELLELGKYISCCVTTSINVKTFCLARQDMNAAKTAKDVLKYIELMEEIAKAEIKNAESAIPLVQHNSRLGWEPSMEYLGDEEHIRWKIKQVQGMIDHQLGGWKKGIEFNL
ncbi:MAG: hypothetical protein IKA17_02900 [Clostridia bacterium]|nr:hypothetical protein [Clostridia bacterium]